MNRPPNPEELPALVETSPQYLTLIRCPFCDADWYEAYEAGEDIEPSVREHIRHEHGPEVIDAPRRAGRKGFFEVMDNCMADGSGEEVSGDE